MISFLKNLFKKNLATVTESSDKVNCRDAIMESDKYILRDYISTQKEINLSSLVKYPNDNRRSLSLTPIKLIYKNESYGVLLSETQFKILQDLVFRLECKKNCTVIDRINAITAESCMLYTTEAKTDE